MRLFKMIPTFILSLILSTAMFAQGPPEPPDGHGSSDDEDPGGNAPVASGAILLLGLASLYGGRKIYCNKRNDVKEAE